MKVTLPLIYKIKTNNCNSIIVNPKRLFKSLIQDSAVYEYKNNHGPIIYSSINLNSRESMIHSAIQIANILAAYNKPICKVVDITEDSITVSTAGCSGYAYFESLVKDNTGRIAIQAVFDIIGGDYKYVTMNAVIFNYYGSDTACALV